MAENYENIIKSIGGLPTATKSVLSVAQQIEALTALEKHRNSDLTLQIGQIVRFKKGMAKFDAAMQDDWPMIVVEFQEPPIVFQGGSPRQSSFGATFDIRCGVLDADGDLQEYACCSSWIEPW